MKSEMAHSAEIKKSYFSLLFWYEKGIFHPGFSKSLLILFRGGAAAADENAIGIYNGHDCTFEIF